MPSTEVYVDVRLKRMKVLLAAVTVGRYLQLLSRPAAEALIGVAAKAVLVEVTTENGMVLGRSGLAAEFAEDGSLSLRSVREFRSPLSP